MGETDETLDTAPTVGEPRRPSDRQGPDPGKRAPAGDPDMTWAGLPEIGGHAAWEAAFPPTRPDNNRDQPGVGHETVAAQESSGEPPHKHDAPVVPRSGRPHRKLIMFVASAVLGLAGAAAAIFGAQALISAGRADADATARADAYAEIDAERTDLAEEALTQVFSVIDVTDAVNDVLETGEAYRQAADGVIEVTNQAVALEDEGKPDEANALISEQGAAAFSRAATAQQQFHEAVTRLQELLA